MSSESAAKRAAVKQKSPPGPEAGAGGEHRDVLLGDCVNAFSVLTLGGRYGEPHLFTKAPADKAPNTVVLPVGGLGDLGNRRTLGPAEKVQDDALFRELARHRRLLRFRALLAGDLLVGALL